jgi:hypothetical protein
MCAGLRRFASLKGWSATPNFVKSPETWTDSMATTDGEKLLYATLLVMGQERTAHAASPPPSKRTPVRAGHQLTKIFVITGLELRLSGSTQLKKDSSWQGLTLPPRRLASASRRDFYFIKLEPFRRVDTRRLGHRLKARAVRFMAGIT